MKLKQYHVLNGDALKEQFSEGISGEIIVMRECLMEGPSDKNNLSEFYEERAQFLFETYEIPKGWYHTKTEPELNRILSIPANLDINLWFEDDLFCQANFWFVVHLVRKSNAKNPVFLIRPNSGNEYNFGKMSKLDLVEAFSKRLKLNFFELSEIAGLWGHFSKGEKEKMLCSAKKLNLRFPFIQDAIQAHIQRHSGGNKWGKPEEITVQIIKELKTFEFGAVFREFCNRAPVYGFGDVQFERILKEVLEKNPDLLK